MTYTAEMKCYIDQLSGRQLAAYLRCAPVGDPWLQGESGTYWRARTDYLIGLGADGGGGKDAQ